MVEGVELAGPLREQGSESLGSTKRNQGTLKKVSVPILEVISCLKVTLVTLGTAFR